MPTPHKRKNTGGGKMSWQDGSITPENVEGGKCETENSLLVGNDLIEKSFTNT